MSFEFECCICMNEINQLNKLKQLNCKHVFCTECIDQIKTNDNIQCPLCRCVQEFEENRKITNWSYQIMPNAPVRQEGKDRIAEHERHRALGLSYNESLKAHEEYLKYLDKIKRIKERKNRYLNRI